VSDIPATSGRTMDHLRAETSLLAAQELHARVEAELAETIRIREALQTLNESIVQGPLLCDDLRYLETRFKERTREVQEMLTRKTKDLKNAERNWRYENLTDAEKKAQT
jgi:hypothetical protein